MRWGRSLPLGVLLGLRESLAASFAPVDLPDHNFVLANPRNFIHVKVQRSGGFAKIVGGSAETNDAGERFVQARFLQVVLKELQSGGLSCTA